MGAAEAREVGDAERAVGRPCVLHPLLCALEVANGLAGLQNVAARESDRLRPESIAGDRHRCCFVQPTEAAFDVAVADQSETGQAPGHRVDLVHLAALVEAERACKGLSTRGHLVAHVDVDVRAPEHEPGALGGVGTILEERSRALEPAVCDRMLPAIQVVIERDLHRRACRTGVVRASR